MCCSPSFGIGCLLYLPFLNESIKYCFRLLNDIPVKTFPFCLRTADLINERLRNIYCWLISIYKNTSLTAPLYSLSLVFSVYHLIIVQRNVWVNRLKSWPFYTLLIIFIININYGLLTNVMGNKTQSLIWSSIYNVGVFNEYLILRR